MKKVGYLAAAGGILVLSCVCGWQYYNYRIQRDSMEAAENAKEYGQHYLMIADNNDNELWSALYDSAREEAAEKDTYLELVGNDSSDDYSLEDYLRIAISSDVDGIILRPKPTTAIKSLIADATEQGIPVVTVVEDDAKSTRTSFVGVNSYQLGEEYGEQILSLVQEDTKSVLVLMNDDSDNSNDNIVFSRMKNTIIGGLDEKSRLSIEAEYINASNEFDSEEAIRDIFVDGDSLPDIMVCLNEIDTECAYQALVDYNQVGKVQIVGFYQSDTILQAVEKGIVPVSVLLDTDQLGEYCIQALDESIEDGLTSEYFTVDLKLLTQDNVQQYLEETEGERADEK